MIALAIRAFAGPSAAARRTAPQAAASHDAPTGEPGRSVNTTTARDAASPDAASAGSGVPAALVRRAAGGDAAAVGALYEATVERIHRYVWLRVRDADTAADLVQDIYVNALRGLPRLDAPERFEAWLLRIAHNRVVNHWVGADRRGPTASLDDDADDDGAAEARALADPDAGALDDAAERAVQLADLVPHLAVLSAAQQDVLALRFGAGLTLEETAAQLGRSEMAIKQLQRRALVTLRARMRGAEVTR